MTLPPDAQRDIQGVALAGFRKDHQELIFVRFGGAAQGAALLAQVVPWVATYSEVTAFNQAFSEISARLPDTVDASQIIEATWLSILISARGYQKLGVNLASELPSGPGTDAFIAGMAERAAVIGDTRPTDAPTQWIAEFQPSPPGSSPDLTSGVDALIVIAADDADDLAEVAERIANLISLHGCEIAYQERGDTLPGALAGHEHFGFKDGISQPTIAGLDPDPQPGEPPAVALGEFLLGYPDETGAATSVGDLWLNGSFGVFRRLLQLVFAFRQQSAQPIPGADPPLTSDQTAAKLVGRWPSGTALATAPVEQAPGHDPGPSAITNAFAYAANDPSGFTTPRFAHIRKVNPRDEAGLGTGDSSARHRMLRRGIPFGPPLPADAASDDGSPRGLHFLAFMADVDRQFEFVQANWVSNPLFPNGAPPPQPVGPYGPPPNNEPPDGADPIVGERDPGDQDTLRQPSGPHAFAFGPEVVNVSAGEYFFAPSITALARLASGATASTPPPPAS